MILPLSEIGELARCGVSIQSVDAEILCATEDVYKSEPVLCGEDSLEDCLEFRAKSTKGTLLVDGAGLHQGPLTHPVEAWRLWDGGTWDTTGLIPESSLARLPMV